VIQGLGIVGWRATDGPVMAFSISTGSMLRLSWLISTKTGVAPKSENALAVVVKV